MPPPVILTVDDEPQVLNAIERDLRRKYRREYRILKAGSGAEALDLLKQLQQRNDQVAVFVSDHRMPEMNGTEFLAEARQLYPDAKKVLLTAYADTDAAINSINEIGLDHYLMKPWDPPETNLFPVLDDLLDDWQATTDIPYDGIRVAGAQWSADSHRVKGFLATNRIPYQYQDIERDSRVRGIVEDVAEGAMRLPVVFLPDGEPLVAPDNATLADKVGLQTRASQQFYDLIIAGGGPAGLGAAVYATSEGLSTAMIERQATGGQAATSSFIENYLGFPRGLTGADLARRATAQAERFGTEILTAREVVGVRLQDPYKIVELDDGSELACHSLIIATGVDVRTLDVPGAETVTGAGLFYGAAMTEAANYSGQHMYVIGGANSSGQGTLFFSRHASKVTMLVRESSLGINMSQYLIDQIEALDNVEVLTLTEVTEVHGDPQLVAITTRDRKTGETKKVETPAMFVFIGAVPYTDFLGDLVERTPGGFILTGEELMQDGKRPKGWKLKRDPYLSETSVPGVFAVGDVQEGASRRVATAVGSGSMAVGFVHQYLRTV
ncbi:MAG: FAD-dependent oxidoreductase [SAR202 cluster bacterium]|nr:FAD-dependent oxidoreductase [SAR202 cluster bacterium]MDP6714963.1 FAD-dependent oxidoreductase [SAR202 cluster bacterium]